MLQNIREKLTLSLKAFVRDERAGTMTVTAVLMPILLGFSGIGLDMTHWYMQKRTAQSIADMSAIEAVHMSSYYFDNDLYTFLVEYAEGEGFDSSSDTLVINAPPVRGKYVGDNGFIEVEFHRDAKLYFASVFSSLMGEDFSVNVSTRAVAGVLIVGEQCIVSLDETMDRAMEFTGTANVTADCGVAANSTSSEAVYIGGNATLVADPAHAVGDIAVSGSGNLVTASPVQSYAEPIADPFTYVTTPADTACDYTNVVVTADNAVLPPGKYCGDLEIKASNVVFSAGTYVIYDGDFITNANSSMTGDEVTFVLTGSAPSNIGTLKMNGSTDAAFSAPLTGFYRGILFYQDRLATYMGDTGIINGGSDVTFDGAVYFPSQEINFTGGSSVAPACLMIFSAKVTFSGDSHVGNDQSSCQALGLDGMSAQQRVQLVE